MLVRTVTQDDADAVITLFDNIRYKLPDPSGYNLEKLRDDNGNKYFRSLRLIKNSFGSDKFRLHLCTKRYCLTRI